MADSPMAFYRLLLEAAGLQEEEAVPPFVWASTGTSGRLQLIYGFCYYKVRWVSNNGTNNGNNR